MSVLLTKYNAVGLPASEPITITYQLNERCKTLPEKVSLPYFIKALDMQNHDMIYLFGNFFLPSSVIVDLE